MYECGSPLNYKPHRQKEGLGGGAISGVKLLILAGILTILDMVDRAWSILASEVSGR